MENPLFREMAEKMKRAGESMVQAHTLLVAANGEMVTAMHAYGESLDAMVAAHEEHEDLHVTIQRLEQVVMEQGRDLKALRDRLNGGSGEH